MGVPKFFRFISERYPCLSQLVSEWEVPDFDNLYLDMNGIIHNCSHPGDYDPQFRITEERIFKDIFHYIEVLFRIIKPQKLFFLAVDGVAPRAKMNQQRGRRFRSARESEDRDKEELRKGRKLPEGQRFDSNCITPGTPFMARLQAQLQYFISSKISTDKAWQNVKIILSGHECPGEGEHKIMDYIRYIRVQPDYDANTRHCLYGLDADLIMLGLCTHEPHFSLLREEVKFGKKQTKKILSPEETKFFLLHLSLLREYLEMEFHCLKEVLPYEFNLENIIDDWVLMGFLVGNDFIPHLPGLHIASGALPLLYQVYCEVLPELDGYLNEGGTLNLARFEAYMKKLASFDIKQFKELYGDFKYLKSKCGGDANQQKPAPFVHKHLQPFFEEGEEVNDDGFESCKKKVLLQFPGKGQEGNNPENLETEKNRTDNGCILSKEFIDRSVRKMMDLDDSDDSDGSEYEHDEEDRLVFFREFCLHKTNYYEDKLECGAMNEKVIRDLAEGYIRAIQWNLNYYYNGLCSWSWFYPQHYAPYISDVQNFKNMKIEFELGTPFLPFEQLLAVLPAFSKNLLPKPFQDLMTDEKSPVLDYYPVDFQTDLNGKKNDWEALVLIPFIDEKRLLDAMNTCYHRLTDEEKDRNKHGPMHVFTYSSKHFGRIEAPAYFPPIEKNYARRTLLFREDILVAREKLQKGLLPGILTDVYFLGFPTFKHVAYTSELRAEGVKVFQSPSQSLSMIVKVEPAKGEVTHENLVELFMNKTVFVDWPYLSEAKVVGIKSAQNETCLQDGEIQTLDTSEDANLFKSQVKRVSQTFLKSRGIDAGVVDYLITVRPFEGQKYVFTENHVEKEMNVHLEKKWSDNIRHYPVQLVIQNVIMKACLVPNVKTDDIFPIGCHCFILNARYYGCLGVVTGESEDGLVKLKMDSLPEPNIDDINIRTSRVYYYTNGEAAQRACIPNHLLARITGTILVLDTDDVSKADKCAKVNVGLNLKFSRRNQQLPGYTKRLENNQWLYSDRTILLIREYADAFPEVIKYLAKNSDKDLMLKTDIFPLPGQHHMLKVISNWLDSKAELKNERRNCDAELLEPDEISELESRVEQFLKKNKHGRYINLKVKPNQLYKPTSQVEKMAPDPVHAEFQLLDRVVNVREFHFVPVGSKGTVIGIETQQEDSSSVTCDVLFDQTFPAAVAYYTKKKRIFKVKTTCLLNITCANKRLKREQKQNKQRQFAGNNIFADRSQNVENVAPNSFARFLNNARSYSDTCKIQKRNLSSRNIQTVPTYIEQEINLSAMFNMKLGNNAKPPKSANLHVPLSDAAILNPIKTAELESECNSTQALKKLLKISSDSKTDADSTVERQEVATGQRTMYHLRLIELFQKARRPIPNYTYQFSNGYYKATLRVPGIDFEIEGEDSTTKEEACEKTAFLVLRSLNVVKKYGDPIAPILLDDEIVYDLNMTLNQLQCRSVPFNPSNSNQYTGNADMSSRPDIMQKSQLPLASSVCSSISSPASVDRRQIAFMANYFFPVNVSSDVAVNTPPFYPPQVHSMFFNQFVPPSMPQPPPVIYNSYTGAQYPAQRMCHSSMMQSPFSQVRPEQLIHVIPPYNVKNNTGTDGIQMMSGVPNFDNENSNVRQAAANFNNHGEGQVPQPVPPNPDKLFSSASPLVKSIQSDKSRKPNPVQSPFPPTLAEIRDCNKQLSEDKKGLKNNKFARSTFVPAQTENRNYSQLGEDRHRTKYKNARLAFATENRNNPPAQSSNAKFAGATKKSPQQPITKSPGTPKSSKKGRLAANFSKKTT